MILWIGLLLGFSNTSAISQPPGAQDYFSQAVAIQNTAWQLKDPSVLRQYTVLLTEFYSQQFLFRAFALSDLKGGENLWRDRRKTDTVQMSATKGLVENNLEDLLVRAKNDFGDDINIRFAIAQYLYRGKCCITKPRLKMKPAEIVATFEEAAKANIVSAASLYILALRDLAKNDKANHIYDRLEQAHQLNPHDADLLSALSSQSISLGKWNRGGQAARRLFEIAPTPDLKAESLFNIARVFFHQSQYDQALKAARASLDIQPRLALSWNVGLDCLRIKGKPEPYHTFIQDFLDGDLKDPILFRTYLDYLRLRGVTAMDQSFFSAYANREMPSDLARMTQQTNVGNLHLQLGEFNQALSAYEQARVWASKLDDAPPEVGNIIEQLINLAKRKATQK